MTHSCTDTPRDSVPTCEACVADSECMADHRCISMTFDGDPAGSFCMKTRASGCAPPFGFLLHDRVSLSGAPAETYCGIDETTVSCDAVRAFKISCQDDSGDPDVGLCMANGALCREVVGIPNRCTYSCTGVLRCPDTFTCNGGYCGS